MASDERTASADLSHGLGPHPQSMGLFQAISLLERSVADATPLGQGSGRGEALSLSAQITLAFAPSDIAEVQPLQGAGPRWLLRTPLMALAGVDGPLPLPDTERLLQSIRSRDPAPLAFLDIFHHRWLSFLYRSRVQHRIGLQWRGPADSPLARALDAIGGLGLARGARGPSGEWAWLRQAALQGPAPRSMAGLTALLSDRLGLPVSGQSCVGGWLMLDINDTPRLGRGAALGGRAVLGQRAWDASAGIALQVGPVPAERWQDWLAGGRDCLRLHWLTSRHVQQDLQLRLDLLPGTWPAQACPRLGQARLGWSAWLSRPNGGTVLDPVRLRLPSTGQALAAGN